MLKKTTIYLVRVALFLTLVLVLVSIFGNHFGINIESYKQEDYNLLFVIGMLIAILFLLIKLKQKKDTIKKCIKLLIKKE
ncbi:MAG: hypothetical protein J7J93_02895 [Candidatus Aenigmarchaeota archaeon]|nr:hypothetical protein [Candidatus Aenigmarchaeota archaeon]